ncbi:hypothetical protein QAD02_011708 [Eretmocerus hayati]|uniref:Uncharacterized protein n=1 Tax=Eretmocerus hayati TaxID=131215 RepID=A0ACC2NXR8_9HYME|nr:hypothetical protein QAD02_011708 [Eretmocerus hayati]
MVDVPCIANALLEEPCKEDFFTKSRQTYKLSDSSGDDFKLLQWRVPSVLITRDDKIRAHHRSIFLDQFSSRHAHCCNPLGKKEECTKKKGSRVISLEVSEDYLLATGFKLIPDQKFCPTCRGEVQALILKKSSVNPKSQESNDNLTLSSTGTASSGSVFMTDSQEYGNQTRILKRMLDGFEIPIPKRHSQSNKQFGKVAGNTVKLIHTNVGQGMNSALRVQLDCENLNDDTSSLKATIDNLKSKELLQKKVSLMNFEANLNNREGGSEVITNRQKLFMAEFALQNLDSIDNLTDSEKWDELIEGLHIRGPQRSPIQWRRSFKQYMNTACKQTLKGCQNLPLFRQKFRELLIIKNIISEEELQKYLSRRVCNLEETSSEDDVDENSNDSCFMVDEGYSQRQPEIDYKFSSPAKRSNYSEGETRKGDRKTGHHLK